MKRWIAFIAVGTVLLASCGSETTAQESAPSTPTEVQLLTWVSNPPMEPLEVINGDMCDVSNISQRGDAFRCYTESEIFDPCFVSEGGAVCPTDPFSNSYTLIVISGDAGMMDEPTAEGDPWGIVLSDGAQCTFLSGATEVRGDLRWNYACSNDLMLWGSVDDTTAQWTIDSSSDLETPLERVTIAKVIY